MMNWELEGDVGGGSRDLLTHETLHLILRSRILGENRRFGGVL